MLGFRPRQPTWRSRLAGSQYSHIVALKPFIMSLFASSQKLDDHNKCVGRHWPSTQREDGAMGRDTNGHRNHLRSNNHTVKRSRATDGFSNWFIISGAWFIRPVIKLLSRVFFCSTLATESKWQIVWASHICWSNLNYWWQDAAKVS